MQPNPEELLHALPDPTLRDRLRQIRRRWLPRLRILGRILLVLTVLLILFNPDRAGNLTRLWVTLNVGYGFWAGMWALFHWRVTLWPVRDTNMRWSICLALLSTLILYSVLYSDFNNLNGQSDVAGSDVSAAPLFLLVIGFLFFCVLMGWGMLGGAIGAFAGRHSANGQRAARVGIKACMVTYIATLLAIMPFRARWLLEGIPLTLLFCSYPLWTRAYLKLTPRADSPLRRYLTHASRVVERRMVWQWRMRAGRVAGRWPQREVTHTLDMRGAALGVLVAGGLLLLPPSLVGPMQSQALTTLIRLSGAVANYKSPSTMQLPLSSSETVVEDRRIAHNREQFVVLRMDAQTRYDASKRSEAAIQADMIARLQRLGAARIVLPMPYLRNNLYPVWTSRAEGPAADGHDVERNKQDLKKLLAVVHACPSVVLAVPPTFRHGDANEEQLLQAAPTAGMSDLVRSTATYLPIVSSHWKDLPPLPVLLCAALKAPGVLSSSQPPLRRLQDVPGCALPHVSDDGVLISFAGRGPTEDFLHATYAGVRDDAPLLSIETIPVPDTNPTDAVSTQPRGEWKPASHLLRGRTVFLDSLAHPTQATPVGVMTQPETQAYAAATLLSGEAFQRVAPIIFVLLTLLLGALVGHTCAHREPLDAVLRALVPLFLVLAGCIDAFLNGYWFDPVLPILTVGTTLALATQLRFTRERADRQRTSEMFGRFVAPHKVQEWLAQSGEELGLGGKREKLCVLFADVRNFTPFAEQHDATEVIDVINAYMTALTDALSAYNGVLDKYTGDGLMAFFLVQKSEAEDVAHAVRATLAMRDAALALSRQRAREGKTVLHIGLSLHLGEAVVGLVGNIRQQINYTVLGLTVVVAARLQAIAQGGDIVVSEEVFRATQHAFVFEVGEPVQVKGLSTPVHPYRVLAPQTRVSTEYAVNNE